MVGELYADCAGSNAFTSAAFKIGLSETGGQLFLSSQKKLISRDGVAIVS